MYLRTVEWVILIQQTETFYCKILQQCFLAKEKSFTIFEFGKLMETSGLKKVFTFQNAQLHIWLDIFRIFTQVIRELFSIIKKKTTELHLTQPVWHDNHRAKSFNKQNWIFMVRANSFRLTESYSDIISDNWSSISHSPKVCSLKDFSFVLMHLGGRHWTFPFFLLFSSTES